MRIRVAVHNNGRGVVRAGLLNIIVPAEWTIRPDDDPHVVHYGLRGVAGNAVIEPGRIVRVGRRRLAMISRRERGCSTFR